ncbi:hypothetical protein [Nitrosomonas marina]|nr:hypothetical protein [Nitrosomonas marina]
MLQLRTVYGSIVGFPVPGIRAGIYVQTPAHTRVREFMCKLCGS